MEDIDVIKPNTVDQEPILSISVAAYNIADCIEDALSSLAVDEYAGRVEVFVINDGSTDNTLEIARGYESRYPDIFTVIDKPNGGYGSTINASVELARGKYFKQLDGDDWFDRSDFEKLLSELAVCDADLVICNRRLAQDGSTPSVDPIIPPDMLGKTIAPGDMRLRVGHWHLVVKTRCLRDNGFELPEHTLYTDQLLTLHSLAHAKSILCLDLAPYCYRIGRDGQSVTLESRIKNVDQLHRVNFEGIRISYEDNSISPENRNCLLYRCGGYYASLLKTYMLRPASRESRMLIIALEDEVKNKWPEVYEFAAHHSGRVKLARAAGHWGYWLVELLGVDNWA